MRLSPRFVGAAAFALIAGVVSGAVIGSVPPMRQVTVEDQLPEKRVTSMVWHHDPGPPPPNQHPIETAEGRFEVEQLSFRGLYRNARFARHYVYPQHGEYRVTYASSEPASAKLGDGYAEVPDAPAVEWPADAAPEADEILAATGDTVSGSPGDPPTAGVAITVASAGPRIIDVAAELAKRR